MIFPVNRRAQNKLHRDFTGEDISERERVTWDDVVTGLGQRKRGASETWILQWREDGRSRKTTFGRVVDITTEQARQLAWDVLEQSKTGVSNDVAPSTTMAAFSQIFLRDCAGQWKAGTLKTNRGIVDRQIVPGLGTKPVSAVTIDDVLNFMSDVEVAEGTKPRVLAVLSGLMKHAELRELRPLLSNPCKGMRRSKTDFVARYLSKKEYAYLGQALNTYEVSHKDAVQLIRFLALTGCRLSEARDLTWEMIDGNRAALPDAKGGPAAIWLGAPVKRLLASRPKTNPFVFARNGDQLTHYAITTAWNDIRAAIKIPELRLHDLRHSYASTTVNLGYDLRVIKDLLSHKDLKTTQGYAKLDDTSIKKASGRVGRHFEKLGPFDIMDVPKPQPCRYAAFAKSKHTDTVYCRTHNLHLERFRKGMIAWRIQQGEQL